MKQQAFSKTIKLIEKYKIPFAKSKLVKSEVALAKAAKEIGFPLAMKIISKDIVHKSDAKGVRVGLNSEEEVTEVYNELMAIAKRKKADVEGILLQKIEEGKEVIIGVKRDEQFGPVVMFGMGGIFVEVMEDVSFRVAPLDKQEAEKMINEIKSKKILEGVRGEKPVNIAELASIIVNVSKLAYENKYVAEMDLNPVIVNEKTAKAVDVRIMTDD